MASERWAGAPSEVLLEVLHLSDAKTVSACLRVNHWWKAASVDRDVWYELCCRDFPGDFTATTLCMQIPLHRAYRALFEVTMRVKCLAARLGTDVRNPANVDLIKGIYTEAREAPYTVARTLRQLPPTIFLGLVILGVERLRVVRDWAKLVLSPIQDPRDFLFYAMVFVNQLHDPASTPSSLQVGIEKLAAMVRSCLDSFPGEASKERVVAAMALVLFKQLKGNRDSYYDARNSYLGSVLSRMTGIPIALSIVWILVAKQLGVEMHPVGFPCHFMLSVSLPSSSFLFSPLLSSPFSSSSSSSSSTVITELSSFLSSSDSNSSIASSSTSFLYINAFDGNFPRVDDMKNVLANEFQMHDNQEEYLGPLHPHMVMARVIRNLIQVYATSDQEHRLFTLLNLLDLLLLLDPTSRPDGQLQQRVENEYSLPHSIAFRLEVLRLRSLNLQDLQTRNGGW